MKVVHIFGDKKCRTLRKKVFLWRDYLFILGAIVTGALSQPLISSAFLVINNLVDYTQKQEFLKCVFECITMIIIGLFFAFMSHSMKSFCKNELSTRLRVMISKSILQFPITEFRKKDSSEYFNDILKKVDIWRESRLVKKWNVIEDFFQIISIFAIEFFIDIRLGIMMFIFLVPMVLNNVLFPRIIERKYQEYIQFDNILVARIKEMVDGFETIKHLQYENVFLEKIKKIITSCNIKIQKLEFLTNCSGGIANIGVTLSQTGSILLGIWLWKQNHILMGSLITTIQFSMCINEPVVDLINSLVDYRSTAYLEEELADLLNRTFVEDKNVKNNVTQITSVNLKDISFQYQNQNKQIFNHLNFTFKKGNKYLILGESGVGKSTLFKLLLGEVSEYTGEYLINDCMMLEPLQLNNYFTYVPQKIFIFDDTLMNNIDVLKKNHAEILKIIESVHLLQLVNSKIEGVDCLVDDNRETLSGGEKARIGLARALIEDKDILLIDELLSSLDKDNALDLEKLILDIEDKIVIHIAHKSSPELMERYDKILELREGELLEVKK